MPNKRKTRTLGGKKRPKPTIPQGDEGKNLGKDLRQEKLGAILDDFDSEIESRLEQISTYGETLIHQIDSIYIMELLKIPKNIKEMKVEDFLAAGGVINSKAMMETQNLVESLPLEPPRGLPPRTRKPSTRKAAHPFTTPAQRGPLSKGGWETPLITPKFDPRLPITPSLRNARQGERLVSLAGSPVAFRTMEHSKAEIILPMSKDKTITVTSTDDVEIPELDASTMAQLKELQNKLNTWIEYNQQGFNKKT